jgi:hypothetical protein
MCYTAKGQSNIPKFLFKSLDKKGRANMKKWWRDLTSNVGKTMVKDDLVSIGGNSSN